MGISTWKSWRTNQKAVLLRIFQWVFVGLAVVSWMNGLYVVPYACFGLGVACLLKITALLGGRAGPPVPLAPALLDAFIQSSVRLRWRMLCVFCGCALAGSAVFVFRGLDRWSEFLAVATCLEGCLWLSETRKIGILRRWKATGAAPLEIRPVGPPAKTFRGTFAEVRVTGPGTSGMVLRITSPDFYRAAFACGAEQAGLPGASRGSGRRTDALEGADDGK